MNKKVRVRFAPSPTGGLHLGGVRTVLFNYLFTKQHGGDFILRIEDTDQTRFVEGAEEYIFNTLEWCGLIPDESPRLEGPFAPYRQSDRKPMYREFAEKLVADGFAYYAFDTAEDLDKKRKTVSNFQYSQQTRMSMKNSLTLPKEETNQLLADGAMHVVRIKMPENETITFTDMIRGEVSFNSSLVDDKVLLKADGMPTYHLAVVVDDYKMEITHAFRGEEWLPSSPVHILLWKYLFGLENMPQWAHLPLILKPDGNGKLSKRDGDRLGFPVFAMDWMDPRTKEKTIGFRERGFLPEAFVNMLAMLGWNDGSGQEIFSLEELVQKFSIERVHKGGAKFDYEKAKWFNGEWMKKIGIDVLCERTSEVIKPIYDGLSDDIKVEINEPFDSYLKKVALLIRDRLEFLTTKDIWSTGNFWALGFFFFRKPDNENLMLFIESLLKPKWDEKKNLFFIELIKQYETEIVWNATELEKVFKELAAANGIKPGDLMLPLRIMLVGGKFGPVVFDIAEILGKAETIARIKNVLALLESSH